MEQKIFEVWTSMNNITEQTYLNELNSNQK